MYDRMTRGFQSLGQILGHAMHARPDFQEPFGTMIHSVHSRHDGEKYLRRADVGCGFFSPDMLLACLECHAERPLPAGIH